MQGLVGWLGHSVARMTAIVINCCPLHWFSGHTLWGATYHNSLAAKMAHQGVKLSKVKVQGQGQWSRSMVKVQGQWSRLTVTC